ncbi:MAG: cytochrome c oxidase subunit 3 [Xanthobacteraceae bacterium]|nr:MAG: cytochrome c oxidase subunit 3 [Xanthobacteraceae bacterium]HMN51008.1 cytochrome c oxidase subunit 3 [Xanthobacteraceae bacterium]
MADAHAKPQHDYHLVNPSPWPLLGAFFALVMAVGTVLWMRGGTSLITLGAFIGLLYVATMWWRDIVIEAETGHHTKVVQLHLRYGMILFIASEVMFFVAWFWAYFDAALFPNEVHQVERALLTGGHWPPAPTVDSNAFKGTFDPWHLPLLNTLILLTSGTTVTWAHHAMIEGNRKEVKQALWLTVALGAIFTCVQAYEYAHAAFTFGGHIYGATFFMATGFHGVHVLIGTIFLAVCLYRVYLGHFTPTHHFGFEAAAWYWHFVDVVWLFLFVWIYVWGAGTPLAH